MVHICDFMNCFNVFFHPFKCVTDAFENPSLITSLILVLLPVVAAVIGQFFYQYPFDAYSVIGSILSNLITWIVVSIILFLIYITVKDRKIHNYGFSSFLSVVSLQWIFIFVITLLGLFLPLNYSPELISEIRTDAINGATYDEVFSKYDVIAENNPNSVNMYGILLIYVFQIIVFLFWMFYSFVIIHELLSVRVGSSFVIWLIFLFLIIFFFELVNVLSYYIR